MGPRRAALDAGRQRPASGLRLRAETGGQDIPGLADEIFDARNASRGQHRLRGLLIEPNARARAVRVANHQHELGAAIVSGGELRLGNEWSGVAQARAASGGSR